MATMSQSTSDFSATDFDPRRAWQAALGELQLQVTPDIFEMYLQPTRFLAYEDGTFLINVPNGFVKDWLDLRLNRAVKKTLRHIVNREIEVRYSVQPPARRDSDTPAPAPLLDLSHSNGRTDETAAASANRLSDDYTFQTFIIGSNNRMAHAAAVAVADQPGGHYNPLFIYSGVGLGKTHLMHAICHKARQRGRQAVYVSCESFTNDLVSAIRTNTQDQFRAKYRTSDLLLVDDIQFLAGKPSTQEELFHTFNTLYESGKQIVLACDRPPKAMSTLESRLRSRFEWGLITDIQTPDLEMRMAILQSKAASHRAVISNEVLERIAFLVPTNIRELEGALTKVLAHASLTHIELTPEAVDHILVDMVPPRALVEPETLIAMVAREFNIPLEQITSPSRRREIVQARQIAMFLLRNELDVAFTQIGALFGGRDHATAMHSVTRAETLLQTDDDIQRKVERLKTQMGVPQLAYERVLVRP